MRLIQYTELDFVTGGKGGGGGSTPQMPSDLRGGVMGVAIEKMVDVVLGQVRESIKRDQEERKRLGIEPEPIKSPEENNSSAPAFISLPDGLERRRVDPSSRFDV